MSATISSTLRSRPGYKKSFVFQSGWAGILVAIGVLVLFLFVIGPLGLQMKYVKPLAEFIQENNINANAYYYSEVDEFFDAERHMREYLALIPGAKHSER